MRTFAVDDVTPAAEPLPVRPAAELHAGALAVGGDKELPLIEPDGVHPLLGAVARAFADHRPLVLSPDAVWLTITAGVAQHIRLHAEQLRPELVVHEGRKRLSLTVDGPMPSDPDAWAAIIDGFGKQLGAHTTLFECDFSTSTEVERVAARVVLLDAYSPYFALWVSFVCGIPSITLTGTADDWQRIRDRIDLIAGYGLQTWCRSLAPIADQFVRAASGDVDTAFWRRIYSPADAYGENLVTGWAARFYPYLTGQGVADQPNPLLELPLDEPKDLTGPDRMGYRGPGVATSSVPATLSRVVVGVNDRVEGDNRTVALHAGLVGVTQDGDGALRPVAGWHLVAAPVLIEDVLDRLVRDHPTTPPVEFTMFWTGSADLVAVYRRIGSAELFGGGWRLRPIAEQEPVSTGPYAWVVEVYADLPGGLVLGAMRDEVNQVMHWVTCRVERDGDRLRVAGDPPGLPAYGTSLALILDAALDSGGDIEHLRTGTLTPRGVG